MNYKYIEDLLERYFQCQTTDAEEQILHNFFLSEDVPAEFAPYADLFGAFRAEAGTTLPADFDSRLSQRLKSEQSNRRPLRARIAAINRSLRPFYKAAAALLQGRGIRGAGNHRGHRRQPVLVIQGSRAR